MSKHYTFQHTCGHIGIGPLLRPASCVQSSTTGPQPSSPSPSPSAALESINLDLPFPCPFCENTQSYQNVASGDGLLVILEPLPTRSTIFRSTLTLSLGPPWQGSSGYNWRVLRVLPAHEVQSRDWYLAHAVEGQFRQMAWIPKPCGIVSVFGGGEGLVRNVSCVWRQRRGVVRSMLPGMWSTWKASLRDGEAGGGAESLPETFVQLNMNG